MSDPVAEALDLVRRDCEARVPEDVRDEVLIEADRRGRTIEIVERHAPWNPDFGTEWSSVRVAQLRFDPAHGVWTLHARIGDRWTRHPDTAAAPDVARLLGVLDEDPYALFWG